jgi:hypothetical protein
VLVPVLHCIGNKLNFMVASRIKIFKTSDFNSEWYQVVFEAVHSLDVLALHMSRKRSLPPSVTKMCLP